MGYIDVPTEGAFLIRSLQRYGHKAYFVGGCVRDSLLGRKPNDWDICTNATPKQVQYIIETLNEVESYNELYYENRGMKYDKMSLQLIPTGIQHGTVTVVVDGQGFEVTTFRQDGNYSDGRRPDNVTFSSSLKEDLARRDFTINAIALNPQYESLSTCIIDYYNGKADIENQIIRCVGNPNERFNEDGLRILRAIRFAAQLGFNIEEQTAKAIHDNKHLLKNISKERIQSELFKILNSNYCGNSVLKEYSDVLCVCIPEIEPMINFQQNNPWHRFDVWEHTLHCLDFLAKNHNTFDDIVTRLAVLLHDIGKPYCYSEDEKGIGHFYGHASISASLSEDILKSLKCSNDVINNVCELVAHHDVDFTPTYPEVKRLLNKLGETQLRRLCLVRLCDITGQDPEAKDLRSRQLKVIHMLSILNNIIQENECFQLKDLAINGKDLIECGIPEGKQIGVILNELLQMVIDDFNINTKEKLLEYAKTIFECMKLKEGK